MELQGSNLQNDFNVMAAGTDTAMFSGSVAGNRFSGLLPSDGDVTVWGGFGARAGVGGLRLRGPLGFLG
ncbi:MAG: hypothetical protein QUV07_07445 [Cyanobium sp. CZS 25K]|nr:hypothetical protein [Cyanobium sp. CZS25K]